MKLSPNKEKLQIAVTGDLTAKDVDSLVQQLIAQRSLMQPEVPVSPPTLQSVTSDNSNITVVNDPGVQIALLRDGQFRLWLQHFGIGWMAFNIPLNNACAIRDYLVANTSKTDSTTNLVVQQEGERDLPH